MVLEVSSFRQFLSLLETLNGKRRLFAFVLCDERPSSVIVGKYFLENIDWLNSLANSSKMYVFIYQPIDMSDIFPDSKLSENPSLKVANLFKIKPNQLPGIVFFTLPEFSEGNGVFFPLDEKMFVDDLDHVEDILSNVFSAIQKAQKQSNAREFFQAVKTEIEKLAFEQQLRPVNAYLNKNLVAISNIPVTFFTKVGEILGDATWGLLVKGKGID